MTHLHTTLGRLHPDNLPHRELTPQVLAELCAMARRLQLPNGGICHPDTPGSPYFCTVDFAKGHPIIPDMMMARVDWRDGGHLELGDQLQRVTLRPNEEDGKYLFSTNIIVATDVPGRAAPLMGRLLGGIGYFTANEVRQKWPKDLLPLHRQLVMAALPPA